MKQKLWYILVSLVLTGCSGSVGHRELARQIEQVDSVHAYLRAHRCLPVAPDIDSLAQVLEAEGHAREAGMALYISGAGKNIVGDDEAAMQVLKKAEQLLLSAKDVPPFYPGMTYYKMGRISENEMLYEVALHYYRLALPYLEENAQPLYLASVYRELARMTTDTVEQRHFFDEALRLAESLDTMTRLDIRYAMLSRLEPQSPERLEISRYLCDSLGQRRFAQDVARVALRQGNYQMAEHYLRLLGTDETSRKWSQEKRTYLRGLYLHQTGHDHEAFEQIHSLYENLSAQLEADGRVRSFAIAQRFDNAAEREKNLRLEIQQQRLYATLAIVIAIMLIVLSAILITSVILASKRRIQRQIEKMAAEAEINRLKNELALRQQRIRNVLMQRVELSKSLQASTIHHKDEGELPEWAKAFIETNIFQTEEQWITFKKEFNEAYEGLLDQLKEEHPALTAVDQQVIALILLEMDISDICLLLNQAKRTVWSRRLRIKEHLGLSENEQLDDWLRKRASNPN